MLAAKYLQKSKNLQKPHDEPSARRRSADAIVVLGAATHGPDIPGPALQRRLRHAVALFRQGDARILLLSGGVVGPPPSEARVMQRLALEADVPADCIILEEQSRNTFENAVYCGVIIRQRRWRHVIVVTDAFHLSRALFVFRWLRLPVSGSGVPRSPSMTRVRWLRSWLDERLRLLRSFMLFALGAHRPLLQRAWSAIDEQKPS